MAGTCIVLQEFYIKEYIHRLYNEHYLLAHRSMHRWSEACKFNTIVVMHCKYLHESSS